MAIGDILQGLFGAGASAYLADQNYGRVEEIGNTLQNQFGTLADTARTNTNFTPYTITGTQGSAATSGDGRNFTGLNVNLNPADQARVDSIRSQYGNFMNNYQSVGAPTLGGGGFTMPVNPSLPGLYQVAGNYLSGLPTAPSYMQDPRLSAAMAREGIPAGGMFYNAPVQQQQFTQGQVGSGLQGALGSAGQQIISQLGLGTGRSEADIYGMLEGMQQPDRERERLALRDELAAQGRLGVSTAQYGGTPEELARAKAVEEARSANAFRAFQLAGEEQGRLAGQRLQAFGIGEQAAGRQDQGLLQSFGLADTSRRTAQDLTQILGSLGLQGQQIGNTFGLGLLGAGVTQRGQDLDALLRGADTANQFNLGLFGQQSQNAIEGGRLRAMADELGLRASDVYGNQLLNQFATQTQGAIAQGQQAVQADANRVGMFGSQVDQQLGELLAADRAYQTSFLPEQNLLDQLGIGADMYEVQQRSLLEGERLAQNADINRLENLLNAETLLANMRNDQNQLIADILLGGFNQETGQMGSGLFDGVFDWLGKSITGLFS